MRYTAPRYAICIVPALVIASVQGVWFVIQKYSTFWRRKLVYSLLLALLVSIHIRPGEIWGGADIQGFYGPADFVVRDQDCVSVLYDGYFNSNFVFHMRASDEHRRVFVFRASKVIFSTNILREWGYNELIKEVSEFHDMLDRYSIKYVIQEEKDFLNTQANKKLRQWVRGPAFRLVEEFVIPCREIDCFGKLLVYEYLNYERKTIEQVDLDMPTLGRVISVRIGK
jgi:hypothetical protein